MVSQQKQVDRVKLQLVLTTHFTIEELDAFCAELGVRYEDLGGRRKASKIHALVTYFETRKRLPDLIEAGKKRYPDIPWDDVFNELDTPAANESSLSAKEPQSESPPPKDIIWFGKLLAALVAILTGLLSVLFSPFILDVEFGRYALLLAFAISGIWLVCTKIPYLVLKVLLSLLITGIAIFWGYLLYKNAQPQFEIMAINTLDGDKNAYEVTDMLICQDQAKLNKHGVGITFTLEIVPEYYGKQEHGSVTAFISGAGGKTIERELWPAFNNKAQSRKIHLTLSELAQASGLQASSGSLTERFHLGDPGFQQTKLTVQIARTADRAHPWATKEIAIRNTPWEFRSILRSHDNPRAVDFYIRNLGSPGWFTVRYRLARLEEEVGSSADPDVSGVTTLRTWNHPNELVFLETGQFFTNTATVADSLGRGRYLIEAYAVKKQAYVQFQDSNTEWGNLNSLKAPWLFGQYPTAIHLFVVPVSELVLDDDTMQAERSRLLNEMGIELGDALGQAEEITSTATGTVGLRQVFQKGEIYVHHAQAYALYGPILDHYKELGGAERKALGFPTSHIRSVVSNTGTTATMVELEGPEGVTAAIYASDKGIAATWPWIGSAYFDDHGGHSGWLGFPLSDEQYFSNSTIQAFENGYIVYYYPDVGGELDWNRRPIAYPYLARRGTLFDVNAQQLWQDTGIQVGIGDRVTIIQIDGAWSCWGSDDKPFDANGSLDWGLREDAPLPPALLGSLIGRVGENDDAMFIAGRWSDFVSTSEGTLYLTMNDSQEYYDDNIGFVTVQIIVEPVD